MKWQNNGTFFSLRTPSRCPFRASPRAHFLIGHLSIQNIVLTLSESLFLKQYQLFHPYSPRRRRFLLLFLPFSSFFMFCSQVYHQSHHLSQFVCPSFGGGAGEALPAGGHGAPPTSSWRGVLVEVLQQRFSSFFLHLVVFSFIFAIEKR